MFEGKNIHYAPDSKLLCSFSNKLCRQRRLNGYGFCIRHILEDKSAPFKQCDYVTSRNNSQKCLNAIPSNQERGYCHSHMQVVGIIPKTERKPKITVKSGDNAFSATDKQTHSKNEPVSSNGVNLNNNHSINKVKASKKKSKSSSSNPNPNDKSQLNRSSTTEQNNNDDNTHSINFVKLNGLSNNVNSLDLVPLSQNSASESNKTKSTKRSKSKQNEANVKKSKPVPTTTVKKKKVQPKPAEENCDGKMTIHDRWKAFKFNRNDTKNEVETFNDLRLMKIMEKLPLFVDTSNRREKNEIIPPSSSFSYQQDQKHNNRTDESCTASTDKAIASAISLQLPKVDRHLDVEVRLKNRKNFLLHVSSAFKSHLKTIRRASKLSKQKDEDDEALRKSLLTCSLTHSRQCAEVLMSAALSGDTSAFEQVKSIKTPAAGSSAWTGARNSSLKSNPSLSAAALEANLIEEGKTSHNRMLGMCNTFSNMKHDMNNVIGANGLINLIDPNHSELKLLAELNDDQNLLLHGRLCDSSPWMNGGMMDIDGDDEDYSLSEGLLNSAKGSKDFPQLATSESRMLIMTNSAASGSKILGKNNLHKSSSQLGYDDATANCIYGVGVGGMESTSKRRSEFQAAGLQSAVDPNLNLIRQNGVSTSTHQNPNSVQPFCPEYPGVSHLEIALRSPIGTANPPYANMTPDGLSNAAVFNSFEPNVSADQAADCNFNDDVADLEENFIPIDQDLANQASQLLEDNGFTEDDFTDLFPETRSLTDHKFGDLGLDFGTTFDTGDIDCAFLVNGFPNARSNGNPESIPITPHF